MMLKMLIFQIHTHCNRYPSDSFLAFFLPGNLRCNHLKTHAALEHHHKQNLGLNPDTLESLQNMLLEHHQYASIYCHAYEILEGYDPNNNVSI